MADEENIEEQEITVPEMWQLVKPVNPDEEDEDVRKPQPPPKIGKLVKMLNDIEDPEELDAKVQEVDPATGQSLLMWATLNKKFVLVEWLVKKCKRNAFAFVQGPDNQVAIFDKWVEIRKEIVEREKEKALQAAQAQEDGEAEDEEEKEPEPKPEQLVYDALSEYQDDWGKRGLGLVKLIGELGVYQGSRDAEYTKEGEGRTLYPNGDMYCGQYRNNQRDGLGTYYFASTGMLYTGNWTNNIRDGVGRMVYPDGGRYFGSWARDTQNGDGHYTYPDGSSYVGSWENGVKNGFGTYSFTDGSQYIGAYVDGEFVSGEWRMAQGSTRYYGAFRNDVPFGAGVYIFKYGTEGSFRQEGTYTNGKWAPIGAVKGVHATPQLRLIIQQREFALTFTDECGALHMEHLVYVSNFSPFIRWVRSLNQNVPNIVLDSVQVSSIKLKEEQNAELKEVKLKVVARDAAGKRIRNTDAITLSEPVTKLMVILTGGDKTVCLLKKAPSSSQALNEQLSLPTVRTTSDGAFLGEFIRVVEPAVRVRLHKSLTKSILTNVLSDPQTENSQQDVVAYIQHIHADAMTKLQTRLEEATGTSGFETIVPIRLADIASMSTDAITVAATLRVQAMIAEGKLPSATVEAQRPPTPLPPSAEPRPDIEPLLEAERKALAAKRAAAEEDQ
eukprot:GILI01007486.1.p1 GENE.GILI01007486.1~~GILI01007486.1.p1  ORF type:complete len:681 (+),score=182.20 GILI01007486.1:37-2043(+)